MCGVASAIIGWLTGGFFGDAIASVARLFGREAPVLPTVFGFLTRPLLNPMEDMIDVLIYSLALGGIQIIAGMAIKAYMLIRDGHFWDALFDVGSWWLLFAGIALGALKGIWYVCYAGVAALILTQGRAKKGIFAKLFGGIASLYDITSYLGDVLSYSRLMALMLAGSVIANIVNMLGTMTGSVIGFALVFILGHSFNAAINIVGTYVHASRLQYLEYFGKFYMDGDRAFAPLQINTKYVDIIKEEN
jgi:V/A-type H+-transporting ATPase subunit I